LTLLRLVENTWVLNEKNIEHVPEKFFWEAGCPCQGRFLIGPDVPALEVVGKQELIKAWDDGFGIDWPTLLSASGYEGFPKRKIPHKIQNAKLGERALPSSCQGHVNVFMFKHRNTLFPGLLMSCRELFLKAKWKFVRIV
jgi:hypothetical protein